MKWVWIGLLLGSTLAFTPAAAQDEVAWQGRFYAAYFDPEGNNRDGWAAGQAFWAPLPPGNPRFRLSFGLEAGALRSIEEIRVNPLTGRDEQFLATHSLQRIYGGVAAGLFERRVEFWGGLHLGVLRHEVDSQVFVLDFGTFERVDSDSATELGWEAEAGVSFRLGRRRRTGIDLVGRYLVGQGFADPDPDGLQRPGPDYLQLIVGVSFNVN